MSATGPDTSATEPPCQTTSHPIPLTELERDLLDALTGDFVCTSVLQARARILRGLKPTTRQDRNLVIAACDGLVRRGLAARQDAPNTIWWRRLEVTRFSRW